MKEHASFNRCYRLLWSGTTEQWKPVPETARTAKKGGRGKAANTLTLAGVLPGVAMSLFVMSNLAAQPPPAPPTPPAATQLPTGGNVVGGQASISQSAIATAANMVVNQTSQRAVIDWSSFNVGSGATVQFVQPNAQSVILNRVLDANPTQVFGRINANGQVFLTNPYGVYFAPSASVDVGGLVATTYSISNDDFMAGRYTFNRNGSTARVVNEGNLSASLGGYITLLAPEVQNSGVVLARAGTVAMAAGEQVSLTLADGKGLSGITTTASAIASLIDNKLAVQAPDGQIILSAVAVNKLQAGVIKNSGSLQATSLSNQGGKIVLEADEIDLASTASIDVSGRTRGGTVLMGGDWQGSGDLRQATTVRMAAGATINANATDNGDGGKVVLWSNVSDANSTTTVAGSIYASAGPNGGNGGQIETSGHYLNVDGIQVSTQAPKGNAGEWLLDPANITISSADANYTNVSGTFTPNSTNTTSTVNNATLSTALGSTNITITTVNNGTSANSSGNINIAAPISWSSANTLTLVANDSISSTTQGNISMTGGGSVVFNTGNATTTAAYSGVISGNGSVSKQGLGNLTFSGANTYSGNTTVAAGTLIDSRSNATTTPDGTGNFTFASSGMGTGVVKVLNGATLALTSGLSLANYVEVQGSGASGTPGALALGASGNMYGKTLLKASGAVIGGQGYIYGDITDGGLALGLTLNASGGSMAVFDSKSYSGNTNITGGNTVNLYTSSASTNATFNTSFSINSGSVLFISGPTGAGTEINISGDIGGAGNLTLNQVTAQSNTSLMGKLNLTGTVNSTGTANLVLRNNSDYSIVSTLLSNGNITQAGSGNLTLTANSTGFTGKLNVNAGSTVTIGDGNTSGIVNASIANNGTLNFNRSDNITAPGGLSGNGVLNKLGNNVLTLTSSTNANFTGNVNIQSGIAKSTMMYGLGTGNVTIADVMGAGFESANGSMVLGSLTGGTNSTVNVSTFGVTVGSNNVSTTYAGALVGSATFTKNGTGSFTLSGNSSTFTGNVANSGTGKLVFTNTTLIGNGSNEIQLTANNTTLELQNVTNLANPINASSASISNITLLGSSGDSTLSGIFKNSFSLSGVWTTFNVSTGASLTLSGNLNTTNASNLSKVGNGALKLTGNNTLSLGNWNVSKGVLIFGNSPSIGKPASGITAGNITLTASAITPTDTGNGTVLINSDISLSGNLTLNASGAISGDANIALGSSTTNLSLYANQSSSLSGNISGAGKLILGCNTAQGSWLLSGANTFANLTVSCTTLKLGSDSVLNSTGVMTSSPIGLLNNTSSIFNSGNAILDINGHTLTNSFGIETGGKLINSQGAGLLTGSLYGARSDFEINVSSNSSLTLAGGISGGSGGMMYLLKTGNGTLNIQTPTNNSTGQSMGMQFNVSAGQMVLNSSVLSINLATLTIANNATLVIQRQPSLFPAGVTDNGLLKFSNTAAVAFSSAVTGTGSVQISGTAPVTWSRSSNYTGSTTIDPAATLNLTVAAIGNVSAPITDNGTLILQTGGNVSFNQTIIGLGNLTIQSLGSPANNLSILANNTYTGTTTLGTNATVYVGSLANTSSSGSLGTGNITINDNATLTFARADNTTVYNNITSTANGTLAKGQTNATVDLAGNLNLTGGIKIYSGTLQIDANATLGNSSTHVYNGAISFFNASTFEFSSASDVVLNGNITQNATSYTATLLKDTSVSNLTLNGNNNYTNTVVETGTLLVGSGGAGATTGKLGTGTVVDNASLVFNHSGAYFLSNVSSNITGTGNVTVLSTDNNLTIDRNITLTGANSLIKLMAGTSLAANNATGNVTLSNTTSTTSTGSIIVYAGSPVTVNTTTLMGKMVGASGAVGYKTYNATLSNISSAVAGTRNFFYRVQPTATINGGTVTATKVYDGTTTANPIYTGGGSVTGVDGDTLTGCVTGASYNTSSAGNKSLTYNVALASNNSAWVVTGYAGTVNPTSTVANITQAPLTIQANDAADFVTLAASSGPFAGVSYSGFVHGENATTAGLTGTLAISRSNSGVSSAGNYTLTPSGQTANNYAITYRPGTYTIVPAQQLIIRVNDGTSVYGNASNLSVSSVTYLMPDNVTIANLTSSLTLSSGLYSVNDGVGGTASFKLGLSNATLSGSNNAAVGLWNVGYNNLTIGGTNFNSVVSVGTQTITKRDLTLTTVADNKVYDGNTNATFNISSNRITGDNLTLSTDALGVFASKNATNGTAVTVGNITISGNDASNYNLLSNVSSTTANITPKTLTLSGLTANNKVYDATVNASIATLGTVSGVLGLDDVQVSTSAVTGAFSDKNVGNGKTVTLTGFTMGGAEASNYKIDSATTTANITPKALTVSGLSVAATKVYDGTTTAAPLGTANLQDAIAAGTGTSSDGKAYAGDAVSVTGTPVGTYNSKDVTAAANVSISGLSLAGASSGNYVLTAPAPLAATITRKDLTIKVNDDAQFFTVASSNVGFNGLSYNGLVAGETSANLVFSNTSAPGVPNISTSLNATQKSTAGVYTGALTLDGTVTNSNYNITVQTGNFTVVGADQLLVRVNNVNTTYGSTANLVVGSAQYVNSNVNGTSDVLLNLSVSSVGNQVTVDDGLGSGGGAVMTLSPTVLAAQLSGSNNAKVGIYNIGGTVTCITSGVNFNNNVVVVGQQTVTAKALTATATAADKTYNSNASASVTVNSTDVITGDNVSYAYTSAEFLNKNAGTNKAVTVANISLSGTDAGNYVIQNLVTSTTANISQKALTITGITAANKVYDGNMSAVVNVSAVNSTSLVGMGLVAGDNLTLSATGVFDSKNAGNGKTVNLTSTYGGADAGNYLITSQASTAANITQKTLTITGVTVDNKVYNGSNVAAVNVSALNSTSLVGMGLVTGDNLTVAATGVFDTKNVGTNKTVNLTSSYGGSDAGNYNIVSQVNTTANITAKDVTLAAPQATQVYNGSAIYTANATQLAALSTELGVVGDSVTGVTLTYNNANAATGKTLTVSSAVISDGNGGHNYNVSYTTNTTSVITAKDVTLSAPQATQVYNGSAIYTANAAQLAALSTELGVVGDSVTGVTLIYNNANAATGKTLTVSSAVISDGNGGHNYNVSYTSNTTSVITAKDVTLAAPQAARAYDGTANYTANATQLAALSAALGVAGDSVSNITLAYNNPNATTGKTLTASSAVISDGNSGHNYNVSYTSNTTSVITAKDVTLAAPQATRAYDGTVNYTANVTQLAALTAALGVAGDSVSNITLAYINQNAATGKTLTASNVTISDGNGGHNYNVSYANNTTSVITAKDVTLSAPQATRTYDGTVNYTVNATQLATLTAALGVAGDSVSNITLAYVDQNAATGKTLTASGAVISDGNNGLNYNISYASNTTSVITAKDVTLAAPQATRAYDGSVNYIANVTQLAALSAALGVAGDSVSNITLAYNDKNAATGKTLTASNVTISDGNNGLNYNVSYTSNTTSVITAKDVTLAAPQATRAYDGTVNYTANATQLAALSAALGLAGDSVSNITLAYNDKNAATGKTLTASGATISDGNSGNNYNISYTTNTTSVITPKDITILGITAANKVYDGNTTVVVNVSSVNSTSLVSMGMLSGDSLTVAATGVFDDKNVGTNKTVNLTSAYSGADVGNYNITSQTNTTANITQKTLTITGITAANKVYDGNTSAVVNVSAVNNTSLVTMGMVSGDNLTVATTGTFADKNVGTNKTVALNSTYSGADVGNYNITPQASAWADITASTSSQNTNTGTGTSTNQSQSQSQSTTVDSAALVKSIAPPVITLPPAAVTVRLPLAMPSLNLPEATTAAATDNVKAKETKADATDDSMSSQKALALVTQTRTPVIETANTPTTTLALPATAAATPAPATTTPPTAVASVAAPTSEVRVTPGGAAPPANQVISTTHASGVLPVSVLGDSRMANVGLAFEEQPNDIRIQMTASPDVPKLAATGIRFTGNFKTFMVGNDRGEMVTYQGAMIGKRMVVVAETEASKNLARQDMQTVLAAAITTLGSTGAISLTQMEGVVLDLR